MAFTALTPMLWTDALPETIAFYRDLLGFEVDEYNTDWGWCHLHCGPVALMFARPNEHMPFNGAALTGSLYLDTVAVDDLWERLRDKVTVSYAPANFAHGMREFAIFDNNGYLLQFGRELKPGEEITEEE